MDGPEISRLMHMVDHFTAHGDLALAAECRNKLRREYGIVVVQDVVDGAPRYERAINPKVPAKRRA